MEVEGCDGGWGGGGEGGQIQKKNITKREPDGSGRVGAVRVCVCVGGGGGGSNTKEIYYKTGARWK